MTQNTATSKLASSNIIPMTLPKKAKRRAEDKWSPVVMKFGYTPLPNLLLRAQGKLGISPVQLNVLVQLAEHWWEADKDPHPKKDRIALRIGKSPRQVQRYITQIEKKGFVKRVERYFGKKRQTSNYYSLEGLVAKLKAIEPEFTKQAEQERLRKKKFEASKPAA
jgi:DNA-binding MarR family transcriptional regulator